MAMLISKFHKLIQSKLLWATFLIIVVFTFVIWGTQVPQSNKAAREASSPGRMNGELVSPERFREMYFNTYLTVVMAVGQAINITPRVDEQLRKAAWQRLAALDEAGRMGITASDDEVAAAIQQHEGFQHEGQFHKGIYKAFVQNFLLRMGFSERQFEEHVRQEIVMQKARMIIERQTLVTPFELRRAFAAVTDRFVVDYTVLKPADVEGGVQVSRDDARAFFEKDPAAFTVPEKMRVRYVRIPAAPFIPKVTVTPEEVENYYNENLADYALPEETNEVAEAAADDTNEVAGARYRPFEEVRQEISNELIQRAALDQASDKAMGFVVLLTPDREGQAPSFEDAAKQEGLEVLDSGFFAAADEVKDVDAGPAFNRAAFELTEGAEGYFSNPVQGKDAVYVLALAERQAERVPTFDEVADEVLPRARAQALADALTRRAQEARDAIDKALQAGQSFSNAVAALKLTAESTEEFTSTTGLRDNTYGEQLLRGVLTRNQGELSDLLPLEDGVMIAYVRERKPAEAATFESVKEQLVGMIRRQYGRVSFDGWQDYLLKKADFQERERATAEDEEVPAEEGGAASPADAS